MNVREKMRSEKFFCLIIARVTICLCVDIFSYFSLFFIHVSFLVVCFIVIAYVGNVSNKGRILVGLRILAFAYQHQINIVNLNKIKIQRYRGALKKSTFIDIYRDLFETIDIHQEFASDSNLIQAPNSHIYNFYIRAKSLPECIPSAKENVSKLGVCDRSTR